MKNFKKLLILLAIICLAIAIISFLSIYAKYTTSANSQTDVPIARWNILVNNISIKDNPDISQTLQPIFPGNENIASNIIAPTAEGYFDLNFDFSAADVSFEYEITTSVNENSSVKDLVTTGYSVDDGEKITFDEVNSPIKDTISLTDNIKTQKIRIYVKWNDDENATMDNAADTASTTSGNLTSLNVNISFTQLTE